MCQVAFDGSDAGGVWMQQAVGCVPWVLLLRTVNRTATLEPFEEELK
jgi:hypothetical protein